jgi:argininosuccinate lyase
MVLVVTGVAAQEKRDEFYYLSEMNKASSVMVVEQESCPRHWAGPLPRRFPRSLPMRSPAPNAPATTLSSRNPLSLPAADVTRMHSGRSRQDIGATRNRLFQRAQLIVTFASLSNARAALLDMAARYPDAIVPAYTVGVHGQPISFGHYILAYAEALERNAERLRRAYANVNRSPLGSAALGTSSFPVNRARLADLLGFDGIVENSLDANQISPIDTGVELISVASAAALRWALSSPTTEAQYRMTTPWLTLEEGELTGTSSIMPRSATRTRCTMCALRLARFSGSAQPICSRHTTFRTD